MIQIGDRVSFQLLGSDGKEHKLEDYQGKVIILFSYPKDHTPGCTAQACRFRDLKDEFARFNAVIFGINKDSLSTHQRFGDKHQLSFPLLTDSEGKFLELLGATDGKRVLRNTYVIDEHGILEHIFQKVSAKNNPDEVLNYLSNRNAKK